MCACFDVSGSADTVQASEAPILDCLLGHVRQCEVMRQKFGLSVDDLWSVFFKFCSGARMQFLALTAQQCTGTRRLAQARA